MSRSTPHVARQRVNRYAELLAERTGEAGAAVEPTKPRHSMQNQSNTPLTAKRHPPSDNIDERDTHMPNATKVGPEEIAHAP